MKQFIDELTEKNFQNKTVAFIENGSWAPTAVKCMKAMFEKSKELTYCENEVKILLAVNEKSKAEIDALAHELMGK